ncbi:YutD family protein [Staphylococcus pettenkoferi]|uniref:YutD family protein n=1 Tax=Staphylococcus pettenkoferi TaxID=170573 RepID=A0ABT4BLR8_9STAP|nr:YutD family protein [Staphylococcus pettenkoferi]MCY1571214.1 YutD family protein [Staphylococcus pettenkoferi]MCY1583613.1 YutD family protein [Staphylococcus pettenkoferi]MCY1589375.1 YutD family protein [Staphylococcus pettenkoferi]MCY1592892.1 YutD family protein [Staphylococcus pettenkoferi]MCY1598898.1 YutD family protein [Staphylococcus pettenkoferi]
MIKIDDKYFELIEDYREAFNEEQFAKRYSEILDKYDYVVGDIGYEQLRLKGFYKDANKKVDMSKRFSTIQDYLLEYCNFGCPYFVLRRIPRQELKRLLEQEETHEQDVDVWDDKLKDVKIKPTIQDTEK